MEVIGRKKELEILGEVYDSDFAEFIAVYGRRRVGKTYLIREYFKNQKKSLYFELTGLKNGTLAEQLENFALSFASSFYNGVALRTPKSWQEAFSMLSTEIERHDKNKKIIMFFDELPWLASKRSSFIPALDYFWNRYWSANKRIKLIVCGSAASWMLEKLINAKGGLYNRLTKTILLEPFSLLETKLFVESMGIKYSDSKIIELYMIMGGIPHYLKQLSKKKSLVQNINDICFQKNGLLVNEYDKLFKSLFDSAHIHSLIVEEIVKQRYGISRENLLKKTKLKSGGTFNKRIEELEAAGFIKKFIPIGNLKKEQYFKVIDEYTLFYHKWIQPIKSEFKVSANYWNSVINTPSWNSWAGYSFEGLCLKHCDNIARAINIDGLAAKIGSWREQGAQVDLLFDRNDNAITVCEIKYTSKQFVIDKTYAKELMRKISVFQEEYATNKEVFLCLVSPYGLKKSIWSEELVDYVVTESELFT